MQPLCAKIEEAPNSVLLSEPSGDQWVGRVWFGEGFRAQIVGFTRRQQEGGDLSSFYSSRGFAALSDLQLSFPLGLVRVLLGPEMM